MAMRRAIGAKRLAPYGPAVDGAVVWLVLIYGIGVMDGLAARLLVDPWWVAQALAAAVIVVGPPAAASVVSALVATVVAMAKEEDFMASDRVED
jgi:hypothetical protein